MNDKQNRKIMLEILQGRMNVPSRKQIAEQIKAKIQLEAIADLQRLALEQEERERKLKGNSDDEGGKEK